MYCHLPGSGPLPDPANCKVRLIVRRTDPATGGRVEEEISRLAVRVWANTITVPYLGARGLGEKPFVWDGTEYDVGDGPVRIHVHAVD